ncbi:glycoside hydrolase [Mycena rosella]|uniref:Glycoside hydrolase n=1 Tax=Mycena rosella TaxID=1033263 RepID=A0AAD7MCI4_MYCRO|nr:glycoside hydrolase [Mycena rosella]
MLAWHPILVTIQFLVLLQASSATSNPRDARRDQTSNSCDPEVDTPLPDNPVELFAPFDRPTAHVFRYRTQRSVNLGGWFVHESWMTPSIFQCASGHKVSEFDIASGSNARTILENHWSTFISESDFSYLSSIGINTVRLPIGYWSLSNPEFYEGTPFSGFTDVYRNSWSFVVHAINMAATYNIGVLVDLHGAPGSQNGQPHSGISDRHVGLFNSPANVEKTLAVLTFLTRTLCNVTNVVGIQVLNEPQDNTELVDFYTRAIFTMRQVSTAAEAFPIYIHDGFDLMRFSHFIANRTDFVVQDHHSYFVFTPLDESKPASQHTKEIETSLSASLATASANQRGNLVIDEWSCALTPKSLSSEPDEAVARQDFCTAQMEVYSTTTAGWSFWAYKKEGCDTDPSWCFTTAVGTSLPSDFFVYTQSYNSPRSIGLLDPPPMSDVLSKPDASITPSTPATTPSRGRASIPFRHRLSTIYYRRSKRDTAEQQSSTKGYSDGFLTAGIFYEYDGSRLGFTGQYVEDSIQALGPDVIAPGTEGYYRAGFTRGLSDGEARLS